MSIRCLCVGLTLSLLTSSISAQSKAPLKINSVSIGFQGSYWRPGAWNPVRINVEAGDQPVDQRDVLLGVESVDPEGAASRMLVPFPRTLQAKEKATIQILARIGNASGSVTLRLQYKGKTIQTVKKSAETDAVGMEASSRFYLTLLARNQELKTALTTAKNNKEQTIAELGRTFASIEQPSMLPRQWYGYDAVDVVIMPTSRELMDALSSNEEAAQALAEWVQRGGRLVVFVGQNYQLAQKWLRSLIHCKMSGTLTVPGFTSLKKWSRAELSSEIMGQAEVAKLEPGLGVTTLVTEEKTPILVKAPVGRGQVLLTAFDLESTAFQKWPAQQSFWKRVAESVEPRRPIASIDPRSRRFGGQMNDEIASDLQRGLEHFDEVPVISFGWIALFILIYILIIGPVEYLVLKKLFKRLELTWITFPIVVIAISIGAYFLAYAIKGNDLRINKVDVVDIDLHHNSVQGTTWVTLFSPRIQTWTIGVNPTWGKSSNQKPSVLLSPMNAPDNSLGGSQRPGGSSIFRSPYEITEDGSGLKSVPIPVWAARTFQASWQRPSSAGTLIEHTLRPAKDNPSLIHGTITSKLPVTLYDVAIFYKGSWYERQNILAPNLPIRVGVQDMMLGTHEKRNTREWMEKRWTSRKASTDEKGVSLPEQLMKSILFHTHKSAPRADQENSQLHELDQGWRLEPLQALSARGESNYLDEVIIVGRVALPSQPSQQVADHVASPTQLWLGALPGSGERPKLAGFTSQETYVRIFIPISTKKK